MSVIEKVQTANPCLHECSQVFSNAVVRNVLGMPIDPPQRDAPVCPVYDTAGLFLAIQEAAADFHGRWDTILGFAFQQPSHGALG